MSIKTLPIAAVIAAAGLLAAASAAADISWTVNATFADGGTLTGVLGVDTYGYLTAYDLVTSAKGNFVGFKFTPGGGNISGGYSNDGKTATFFGPSDNGNLLTLVAENSFLTLPTDKTNTLLAASVECQGSYDCPLLPADSDFVERFLSADSTITGSLENTPTYMAPTPEPATWALMLVGVAGLGVQLRRRRRLTFDGPAPTRTSREDAPPASARADFSMVNLVFTIKPKSGGALPRALSRPFAREETTA